MSTYLHSILVRQIKECSGLTNKNANSLVYLPRFYFIQSAFNDRVFCTTAYFNDRVSWGNPPIRFCLYLFFEN